MYMYIWHTCKQGGNTQLPTKQMERYTYKLWMSKNNNSEAIFNKHQHNVMPQKQTNPWYTNKHVQPKHVKKTYKWTCHMRRKQINKQTHDSNKAQTQINSDTVEQTNQTPQWGVFMIVCMCVHCFARVDTVLARRCCSRKYCFLYNVVVVPWTVVPVLLVFDGVCFSCSRGQTTDDLMCALNSGARAVVKSGRTYLWVFLIRFVWVVRVVCHANVDGCMFVFVSVWQCLWWDGFCVVVSVGCVWVCMSTCVDLIWLRYSRDLFVQMCCRIQFRSQIVWLLVWLLNVWLCVRLFGCLPACPLVFCLVIGCGGFCCSFRWLFVCLFVCLFVGTCVWMCWFACLFVFVGCMRVCYCMDVCGRAFVLCCVRVYIHICVNVCVSCCYVWFCPVCNPNHPSVRLFPTHKHVFAPFNWLIKWLFAATPCVYIYIYAERERDIDT